MSDWHFGMDYDMWLYPPVDYTAPDYNFELPEPIEAANIEGTLLVNAEDAIRQVRKLMAENENLRELVQDSVRYAEPEFHIGLKYNVFCTSECQLRDSVCSNSDECKYPYYLHERMRELGIEVNDGGGNRPAAD